MKLVEGWQVPDIDECCINALLVELPDLNVSYTHMNQFRTVIQAGGNIGVYSATMAGQFERVITVEPDLVNYQALLLMSQATPTLNTIGLHLVTKLAQRQSIIPTLRTLGRTS